jgi:hypothetical protein
MAQPGEILPSLSEIRLSCISPLIGWTKMVNHFRTT